MKKKRDKTKAYIMRFVNFFILERNCEPTQKEVAYYLTMSERNVQRHWSPQDRNIYYQPAKQWNGVRPLDNIQRFFDAENERAWISPNT
jgi:hypothetical protein